MVDSNDRERIQEGAEELQKMVRMFINCFQDMFFKVTVVVLVVGTSYCD